MKAFKIFMVILAVIGCIACLTVFFVPMGMAWGAMPIILCVAAMLICMGLGFAFKGSPFGSFFGYLCFALILGIIFYFAMQPTTSSEIWQIVIVDVAVVIGIFLTNILKDLPFLNKLIPLAWFLVGIGVYFIFFHAF